MLYGVPNRPAADLVWCCPRSRALLLALACLLGMLRGFLARSMASGESGGLDVEVLAQAVELLLIVHEAA